MTSDLLDTPGGLSQTAVAVLRVPKSEGITRQTQTEGLGTKWIEVGPSVVSFPIPSITQWERQGQES